jgi:CBS domain-containing protein
MKVAEVMTRQVELAKPDDTIQQAAQKMARLDVGVLPVAEGDRLVGMITDRDIAIRAVGEGKGPNTRVSEIMTREVKYCYEDEDVEEVARNMAQLQVRRLPVVTRDKRLVGIVSLADIARKHQPAGAGEALQGIAQKGGQHSQSADATRH